MSNLTYVEKRKFEQFLGMSTGYVLDFSNRTFAEFVRDSTGRDIYDSSYDYASGSKANRLRAFWQKEANPVVAKLIGDMLDYSDGTGELKEVCRLIVARLLQSAPDFLPRGRFSRTTGAVSGTAALSGTRPIERRVFLPRGGERQEQSRAVSRAPAQPTV